MERVRGLEFSEGQDNFQELLEARERLDAHQKARLRHEGVKRINESAGTEKEYYEGENARALDGVSALAD